MEQEQEQSTTFYPLVRRVRKSVGKICVSQDTSTDPALFKTMENPQNMLKTLQPTGSFINVPRKSRPKVAQSRNTSQNRMKSLPHIKPLSKSHSRAGGDDSGIGRFYKGIFSPNVGKVLDILTKKRFECAPNSDGLFITRKGTVEESMNSSVQRLVRNRRPQELASGREKLSAGKLRAATEKLIDSIMNEGSHSLRSQFRKFVETGDQKQLFFCDFCPHCRLRFNDFYPVKQKINRLKKDNEFFFDFIDINSKMRSSEVFVNPMNYGQEFQSYVEKETRERTDRSNDSELYYQFLTKLIDQKIALTDILDSVFTHTATPKQETIAELNKSIFCRGISLEEDCRKFIASIDESAVAAATSEVYKAPFSAYTKNLHPENGAKDHPENGAKDGPEELTTFGRFYRRCCSQVPCTASARSDDNYSAVLYLYYDNLNANRALQEMIKQLFENTQDKAEKLDRCHTMLKIFRKTMEVSEQKWFKVIEKITKYTLKLKADNEFLLGEFFDAQETQSVLENKNVTAANLEEHRKLLRKALGALYTEEAKRADAEKQIRLLNAEFQQWIPDWDSIRKSVLLLGRLRMVDSEAAKMPTSYQLEYRGASEEEKILFRSAQRFLMALPYKNKWELLLEQTLKEKNKLMADHEKLRAEHDKLQEEYNNCVQEKKAQGQEIAKAKLEIDYVWNKLVRSTMQIWQNIPPVVQQEVQTEISTQEIYCIDQLSKIHEHKVLKVSARRESVQRRTQVQKAIDRIQKGIIEYNWLQCARFEEESKVEEAYSVSCWIFTHLNKIRLIELKDVSIHEILFQIIMQKYGATDAKKECTKILLSMKKLASNHQHASMLAADEKIRFVGDMVGLRGKQQPNYMSAFYVSLLKTTGLRLDRIFDQNFVIKLPLTTAYNFLIKLLFLLQLPRVYECVAKRQHYMVAKRKLALRATIYLNNEKQESLTDRQRLGYLYVHDLEEGISKVYKKSLSELFEKYADGKKKILSAQLARMIMDNSTTPLDEATALDAVGCLFPESGEHTFEEVDKLFYWRIKFEVTLNDYLDVGIETASVISDETKIKLDQIYADYDKDRDRMLGYLEFLQVLEAQKRKKAKWEMQALYDEAKSKDGAVHFDDFLFNLLHNPALKSFFEES